MMCYFVGRAAELDLSFGANVECAVAEAVR